MFEAAKSEQSEDKVLTALTAANLKEVPADLGVLFSDIATEAASKLGKCLDKHRSWSTFKAARVFDPFWVKVHGMPDWENVVPFLPFTKDVDLRSELKSYAAWVKITTDLESEDDFNIYNFWISQKAFRPKLAQMALRTLSIPVSSADAERSFSGYNYVVDYKRCNISNESARIQGMLVVNGDVTKRASFY